MGHPSHPQQGSAAQTVVPGLPSSTRARLEHGLLPTEPGREDVPHSAPPTPRVLRSRHPPRPRNGGAAAPDPRGGPPPPPPPPPAPPPPPTILPPPPSLRAPRRPPPPPPPSKKSL